MKRELKPITNKSHIVWCESGWFPNHYGFCPNKETWDRYRRAKENKIDIGPYPIGEMRACTSLFMKRDTRHRVAIVTVGEFEPRIVADLLIHEATHIWQDIREGIGEEKPSSEFEAYAMQNISAELFAAYEKTRGPLFRKR